MPPTPSQDPAPRFDLTLAGETNLDLILYGLPDPMPVDRELLASSFELTLGGSSSILAHNLAILGSRVGFATRLGHDDLGAIALKRLAHAGLDLTHVQYRSDKSTGVTLLLPHGNRRHILTYLGVMDSMSTADLDLAYLAASRHFHISSLFLQTALQPGLPDLFRELKSRGLTLSLDTNDDPADQWAGVLPELLDLVDILLPNQDELLRIANAPTLEAALDQLAPRIHTIVVKCGPRGALVQHGRTRTWIDPPTVTPVDTIGAGDSFNAGFLHAFTHGHSPVSATRLAVVTGALSTLRPGGTEAFLDHDLRSAFLAEHAPYPLL